LADFSRGIAGALPCCVLFFADLLPYFGQVIAPDFSSFAIRLCAVSRGVQARLPCGRPCLYLVLPCCPSRFQPILPDIALNLQALAALFRPVSSHFGAIIVPARLSDCTRN